MYSVQVNHEQYTKDDHDHWSGKVDTKAKTDMATAECDHTPERLRRLLSVDRPIEQIAVPTFGELYLEWYQR